VVCGLGRRRGYHSKQSRPMTSRHFRFLSSDEKGDWPGDLGLDQPQS
jgi:hypothetical protein